MIISLNSYSKISNALGNLLGCVCPRIPVCQHFHLPHFLLFQDLKIFDVWIMPNSDVTISLFSEAASPLQVLKQCPAWLLAASEDAKTHWPLSPWILFWESCADCGYQEPLGVLIWLRQRERYSSPEGRG